MSDEGLTPDEDLTSVPLETLEDTALFLLKAIDGGEVRLSLITQATPVIRTRCTVPANG